MGAEVRFETDAHDNLTKLILSERLEQAVSEEFSMEEAKGCTYVYNSLGCLLSSTSLEDVECCYTYDSVGNLTRTAKPEGSEICYFYDDADRLIWTEEKVQVDNLDVQDNSVHVRYMEISAETALGKTVYEYNSRDQITSITALDGGMTKFVHDVIVLGT